MKTMNLIQKNSDMKRVFLFISFFVTPWLMQNRVFAQQDPHYSMFMFNALAFNPAVAGSHDDISSTLLYRKQWVKFPGSPQTGTFNMHAPLKNDKIGVGGSFISDQIGSFKQNTLNLAYAYHLKLNKMRLAFGLQAVGSNFSMNFADVKTSQNGTVDNSFAQNSSVFGLNFGTGAYLYNNDFWAGVSAPHLLNTGLEKKQTGDATRARQATHLYVMGGYVAAINSLLALKPSFLVKYVKGAPVQADINAMLYFYKIVGLGVSYRTRDAVSFMTEVNINRNFKLAYAFDQTTSGLQSYQSGSHEIIVQYHFGFNKKKLTSPRLY